ncbi:AbrB family transcriptional regulator [Desulforamulus ruminis]|uniref:Membrane protein AbrB duplication n=1 Tax=Desulforamulus ruminis (strain ATCC 23193 / DSM 2154 / NCIMB 8452 / DL) TaxID=696281 RepID=F6DVC7_DESRL|nr:AbrB family transcriptional regulator [Desulforamulus ruminis]AEG60280.1 membrane protein AbrB duplication [Desulforamulus ruminis DSM 2154]
MDKYLDTKKRTTRVFITLITAITGGIAFKLLHLPIPWLLGPMIAVLIGSKVFKGYYEWPGQARNAGMIIVGYTIGLSMTSAALQEISRQLPIILLMTLLLLLMCTGIAFVVSRLSGSDYKTVLMGSIPGGMTQMIVLAEETEGIDITVVTVLQVIRLMMIIICIPLLIFNPFFGQQHHAAADTSMVSGFLLNWGDLFPNLFIFALVCILCAWLGNKIKLPTAFLLGPAIGTAILQIYGLNGPALPSPLINGAQLLIGTYISLLLKPDQLTRKFRTISLAIGSGLVLILGSWGFSLLLTQFQPVSASTSLLSLSPGGMDQMGIIAHEVHADLSMVAGYQLFRMFFIFFVVPPLLRMIIQYDLKKRRKPARE